MHFRQGLCQGPRVLGSPAYTLVLLFSRSNKVPSSSPFARDKVFKHLPHYGKTQDSLTGCLGCGAWRSLTLGAADSWKRNRVEESCREPQFPRVIEGLAPMKSQATYSENLTPTSRWQADCLISRQGWPVVWCAGRGSLGPLACPTPSALQSGAASCWGWEQSGNEP